MTQEEQIYELKKENKELREEKGSEAILKDITKLLKSIEYDLRIIANRM